jgi:hypothetical protein
MSLNTGISNEKEIVEHLDTYKIASLNDNLRAFVEDTFHPTVTEKNSDYIHARCTNNNLYKPDIIVEFANRVNNVSVKIGEGNSVHQEPIDSFVKYIRDELGASKDVIEALLYFHWGDGTLDGSAPVSERKPAREIIKNHPEKIAIIQSFFNEHIDALLERFMSTGVAKVSHVDYVYYGDYMLADWHSIYEVYETLKSNPSDALSVGGLNFQTYGRSLNGKDDARRKSIQLKWSNMSSFFLVGTKKSVIDVQSKIKGDNSHGFRNVESIIEALDGKRFSNIPDSLKEFVFSIFDKKCSENDLIGAEKVKGGLKGDMLIWLNNKANLKNIAIASGSGNSVHQENVYRFCNFLEESVHLDENTIKDYLRFHFADGTDDNTGDVSSRQSASEYKKSHEYELASLERRLKPYSKLILERFVKTNDDYPDVDYLLYGDTELPYWAHIDTLIDNEVSKAPNARAALAIGDMSIQAWNRSLKGGKSDYKRLSMQVKWNNLLKNVSEAHKKDEAKKATHVFLGKPQTVSIESPEAENKAIEGIGFEYKFTSALNQDRHNSIWNELGITEPNAVLVNATYNQISKIAGSKVRPKSDCYAIKPLEDISQLLEEKNYVLTEEVLLEHNIKYDVINDSGISIKLPTSKSYTLQKLSYSAFKNIFKDLSPAYFVAALLYCDENQLNKNELILATFNTTIDSLCDELGVDNNGNMLDTYTALKNKATESIKYVVNNDAFVYNAICFGDEIFDAPYNASFIFENGRMVPKHDYHVKITVTTGSGRSNGTYNLAFK